MTQEQVRWIVAAIIFAQMCKDQSYSYKEAVMDADLLLETIWTFSGKNEEP
jgi:hypothetical protein